MTEFEVKNYKGQLYMKDELQKILNTNPLRCIANAKAVVLFPGNATLETVKKSLEIIQKDIDFRLESKVQDKEREERGE